MSIFQIVQFQVNEINFNEQFSNCYLIQHYVIKFFQDLRKVVGFLRVTLVSSTNKNEHHDITEILLKMVLNTINQLNPTNFPLKLTLTASIYLANRSNWNTTVFSSLALSTSKPCCKKTMSFITYCSQYWLNRAHL